LVSDHWGSSGDMDSKSRRSQDRDISNNYMNERRSPTPPPMGIPRTPSPSRNEPDPYDDIDDPPPRVPTPGSGLDFKKMQQQSKFEKEKETALARSTYHLDSRSQAGSMQMEKSEPTSISTTPNNNPTSVTSASSDQQCHPKKRWNHYSHNTQQPVRTSSPHTGSVDGRSSVASDCSSTADNVHHPQPVSTPTGGCSNNPPPPSNHIPMLHGSNVSRFRPKGKGFDWNNEVNSPYSTTPPPNVHPSQMNAYPNQASGLPGAQAAGIPSSQLPPSLPPGVQMVLNNSSRPNSSSPQQQQQQKSCVPFPIGRIPPPPPPPHAGKSMLSAVDQVIMQSLNSGSRPSNNGSTTTFDTKDFPQSYNNNVYKPAGIPTASPNYNASNHGLFNNNASSSKMNGPSSHYPTTQQTQQPQSHNYQQQQQHNSYSQQAQAQHSSSQPQLYSNNQQHSGTVHPGAVRTQQPQHHTSNPYPVMQNPKILPSAYSQTPQNGSQQNTNYYNNANGGSQQQQQQLGKSPYENRNGYHRPPPQQPNQQHYQSYSGSGGMHSSSTHSQPPPPPPNGNNKGVHEMYPQQHQGYTNYNHSSSSRQQAQPHHYNSASHHQSHVLPQGSNHQGYNNHPHNNQMLPTRR
jgi:hypothetical protein